MFKTISKWLTTEIKTNQHLLIWSFTCGTIFTLAAHAFCFFNLNLSHDYLVELYALDVQAWKISIGRFLVPPVNFILGQFATSPWLSGIILIIAISLSVFMIIKLFRLDKRWHVILLSGFLSTCLPLAAIAASFTQDLAADAISLLLAVSGTYAWSKLQDSFSFKYFLLAILAIFLSLGCYQGFLSVTIVLVITKCLDNLFHSIDTKKVIRHGLLGIAIIISSVIIYYIIAKIVSENSGHPLAVGTTNSLSNIDGIGQDFFGRIGQTYLSTLWELFAPTLSTVPARANLLHFSETTAQIYYISIVNILILAFCTIAIIRIFANPKITKSAKFLSALLLLIIPFAMNIMHFLNGYSHLLMHYALTLFYLIFIILFRASSDNFKSPLLHKAGTILTYLSTLVIIFNIQIANQLYIKKSLYAKSTESTITRVISAIEAQDNYILGDSKICIIGISKVQDYPKDFLGLSDIFGNEYNSAITYQGTYQAYFDNLLQYPAEFCTAAELQDIISTPDFTEMGDFPAHDSVKTINDIIVVKMSDDAIY